MTDKGTWAKPTNALEIADELLEPVQGFPTPTQLEHRAADALRRQHQIILTLEAAQAQAAGVSVEPSYFMSFRGGVRVDAPYHTPAALTTAIAAARVAAINECANECDRTASDYKGMFAEDESLYIAATDCAKEIRALIGANHGRV